MKVTVKKAPSDNPPSSSTDNTTAKEEESTTTNSGSTEESTATDDTTNTDKQDDSTTEEGNGTQDSDQTDETTGTTDGGTTEEEKKDETIDTEDTTVIDENNTSSPEHPDNPLNKENQAQRDEEVGEVVTDDDDEDDTSDGTGTDGDTTTTTPAPKPEIIEVKVEFKAVPENTNEVAVVDHSTNLESQAAQELIESVKEVITDTGSTITAKDLQDAKFEAAFSLTAQEEDPETGEIKQGETINVVILDEASSSTVLNNNTENVEGLTIEDNAKLALVSKKPAKGTWPVYIKDEDWDLGSIGNGGNTPGGNNTERPAINGMNYRFAQVIEEGNVKRRMKANYENGRIKFDMGLIIQGDNYEAKIYGEAWPESLGDKIPVGIRTAADDDEVSEVLKTSPMYIIVGQGGLNAVYDQSTKKVTEGAEKVPFDVSWVSGFKPVKTLEKCDWTISEVSGDEYLKTGLIETTQIDHIERDFKNVGNFKVEVVGYKDVANKVVGTASFKVKVAAKPTEPEDTNGGGGCAAGFAGLALLAVAPMFTRKSSDKK